MGMSGERPKLRPDISVKQVVHGGKVYFDLSPSDYTDTRRVSARAWQTIRQLDGSLTVDEWIAKQTAENPRVKPESLLQILESLKSASLFEAEPGMLEADNGLSTVVVQNPFASKDPHGNPNALPSITDPEMPHPGHAAPEENDATMVSAEIPRELLDPAVRAQLNTDHTPATAPAMPKPKKPRKGGGISSVVVGSRQQGTAPGALTEEVKKQLASLLPRAKGDLKVVAPPTGGFVSVKNPATGKTHAITEVEYQILMAMDGRTDGNGFLAVAQRHGSPLRPDRLFSLVKQLEGFGFLAEPTRIKAVEQAAPAPQPTGGFMPQEQRKLFQSGLTLFQQGELDQAAGYFRALLDMAPDNAEAQSMLAIIEQARESKKNTAAPGPAAAPPPPAQPEIAMTPATPMAQPMVQESVPPQPAPPPDPEPVYEQVPDEHEAFTGGSDAYEQAELAVQAAPDAVARRRNQRVKTLLKVAAVPLVLAVVGMVIWRPITVTYPCQIEPLKKMAVRVPMDGVILEVKVDEGQEVKEGDVLIIINDAELKLTVAKQQAELERVTAELEELKKGTREEEIAKFQAKVDGLGRELGILNNSVNRLSRLVRKGVAPRAELEGAKAKRAAVSGQRRQAIAELKLAQAGASEEELQKKEAEIRSLQAQLDAAKKSVEATVIKAPMTGVLTTPKLKELVNTRVSQGTRLIEIAKLENMRVDVAVAERDFDVLQLGQPIALKVASFPTRSFDGKVERIPQRVEMVNNLPVIKVEGSIDNSEGLLRPNMTGYAELIGEEAPLLKIFFRRVLRFVRVRFLI
jgi:multidrug resistance efflux pump